MVKFIFYLSFLVLSLGQLTAISKSQGINLYGFDLIVAASSIFFTIYLLTVEKSFRIPKSFIFIFGFLAIGLISLYFNSWQFHTADLISASFYAVRIFFYLLFALCIFNLIRLGKISENELYITLTVSGVLVGLLGIIQLIIFPDFELLDPLLGWDPHKYRLAASFFDPNFTGAYLVIILTIFYEKICRKFTINNLLIAAFIFICIILTFSRSAWLMLSLVIFIYGVIRSPKILLIALLTAFLAYYTTPRIQTRLSGSTDPADSAHFRLISWSHTMEIIKDNIFVGIGFNSMRPMQKLYGFADEDTISGHALAGSDSSLLFVWATTGILGLFLFLYAIIFPMIEVVQKSGFSSLISYQSNNFLYICIIIALLADALFVNSLFYPQILVIWLILLALTGK